MTEAPVDKVSLILIVVLTLASLVAAAFAIYFNRILNINATKKTDWLFRQWVPWWPFLEGTLTEEGLEYRRPWLVAVLAALVSFALVWGMWQTIL